MLGAAQIAPERRTRPGRSHEPLQHPRHAVMRYAFWIDDETCKTHDPDKAESDPWRVTAQGRSPETTLYGTPRWACRNSSLTSYSPKQLANRRVEVDPVLAMLPFELFTGSGQWERNSDWDIFGFIRADQLRDDVLPRAFPGFSQPLLGLAGTLRELRLRDRETGEERYSVDIPATLAKWRQRESERKMGYRTASEEIAPLPER